MQGESSTDFKKRQVTTNSEPHRRVIFQNTVKTVKQNKETDPIEPGMIVVHKDYGTGLSASEVEKTFNDHLCVEGRKDLIHIDNIVTEDVFGHRGGEPALTKEEMEDIGKFLEWGMNKDRFDESNQEDYVKGLIGRLDEAVSNVEKD